MKTLLVVLVSGSNCSFSCNVRFIDLSQKPFPVPRPPAGASEEPLDAGLLACTALLQTSACSLSPHLICHQASGDLTLVVVNEVPTGASYLQRVVQCDDLFDCTESMQISRAYKKL